MLSIARPPFALENPHPDVAPLVLGALENVQAPEVAVREALDKGAPHLARGRRRYDGGVVGVLDVAALVRVQNGRADGEQRRVGGRGRGLGSPDDAVQDGRRHEGAVEEGCVGHGGEGALRGRGAAGAGLVRVEAGQVHAGGLRGDRVVGGALRWWVSGVEMRRR